MTNPRFTGAFFAVLAFASLAGCGEDGSSIGAGQCPNPPLFRYEPQGTDWVRVDPRSGKPLSADEERKVADAYKEFKTCMTPAGSSTSLGAGGSSNGKGTGGSKSADSGRD